MYNHQNLDQWLGHALDIVTPADPIAAAFIRPGYQPIMPQAIYALITTANTVAPTILTFKFRPLIGSAAGELVIGTLTIPIGAAIGNVYYKRCDNVKCLPGGEIVVQTDGGGTAGNASIGLLLSPNWDAPGNNAKMVLSA